MSVGYALAVLAVLSLITFSVIQTNERIDRCAAYGKEHNVETKFDSKTSYCLAKGETSWSIVGSPRY